MHGMKRAILVCVAASAICGCGKGEKRMVEIDSAEEITWFSGEDPRMQAAIAQAQKEFSVFQEELTLESRRILPAMEQCLIKYAFPATKNGVEAEHMFLSDLYWNGTNIVGVLASEPMYTDSVQEGQEVIVDPSRVSDWLYIINGETHGGFTFKKMWETFSSEEKDAYRDQPPFVWLNLD
jgi:uncharacterized protein YegJ (DUF2314 family)